MCGSKTSLIEFGCVSSRTLWVKFKFLRVKVCLMVVVVYGPTEGSVEKRERFWKGLDWVLDKVGNGYRSCVY